MPNITTDQFTAMMRGLPSKPKRQSAINKGKPLESLIMASQGEVLLTKVPQAARRIGGDRIVTTRSSCDFFGIHVPTKRMIIFDAKMSDNPNRLQTSADHLPDHQRQELIRYGESGAIAGLLCWRTDDDTLYWCRWQVSVKPQPSIPWEFMCCIGSPKFAIRWDRLLDAAGKDDR